MKKLVLAVLFSGAAFTAYAKDAKVEAKPTFESLDANKDGGVTPDEAKGDLKKAYKEVDKDADGKVTSTEYDAYVSAKHGHDAHK